MAYNPSRDGDLILGDWEGTKNKLSVLDEADSVTIGIDLRQDGARVSVGVRLCREDVTALQQRLADIRRTRGW